MSSYYFPLYPQRDLRSSANEHHCNHLQRQLAYPIQRAQGIIVSKFHFPLVAGIEILKITALVASVEVLKITAFIASIEIVKVTALVASVEVLKITSLLLDGNRCSLNVQTLGQ